MAITVSSAACTAACNSIVDLLDSAGIGALRFYNAGSTLGINVIFASPTAFGAAAVSVGSGNASAIVPISATCAIASCTVAYFAAVNTATVTVWQGTCTTGSGDFTFSNLSFLTGDTLVVTALNFIVAPA